MDNRLALAMRAFKANPCPETAYRWASLAAKLQEPASGKTVKDLKEHMAHCYSRLRNGLETLGFNEDSPIEEILLLDASQIILLSRFGYISQERFFRGLMVLRIDIPTHWKSVVEGMQGFYNSYRRAETNYEIYKDQLCAK